MIAFVVDTGDKFIAGKKLATGPLIWVCEVSMDAPFHCSSNENILLLWFGGRRYHCLLTAASVHSFAERTDFCH